MVKKKYGNRKKKRLENIVEIPPEQAQDKIYQNSACSIKRGKKKISLLEKTM